MFLRFTSYLAIALLIGACSAEEALKSAKTTQNKSSEKCDQSELRPTSEIMTEINLAVSSLSCDVDSDCKTQIYSDGSGCQPAIVRYSTRQTNERNLFALLEEYSDSANACKKVKAQNLICPAVVFEIPQLECSAEKACEDKRLSQEDPETNPPPPSQVPTPLDRLITEGCSQYYDGCNECSVQADGTTVCTERACVQNAEPYCIQVNLQKCSSWHDGCNSCSATEGGNAICTRRYCDSSQRTRPSCRTLR